MLYESPVRRFVTQTQFTVFKMIEGVCNYALPPPKPEKPAVNKFVLEEERKKLRARK